eukprot:5159769-Amphidinium_carterae.1
MHHIQVGAEQREERNQQSSVNESVALPLYYHHLIKEIMWGIVCQLRKSIACTCNQANPEPHVNMKYKHLQFRLTYV